MRYRFFLLLLASTALVAGSPADDEELGFITLTHEIPTAFYEPAPRSIRLALERTVATYCAGPKDPFVLRDAAYSEDGSLLLESAPEWLCAGGTLTFVRAIYVNGFKSQFGAACASHTRGTIYFPLEWIRTPSSCVPIGYDRNEKRHYMGLFPPEDRDPA